MKPGLRIGDRRELTIVVTEAMQARFEEAPVHSLYGTAALLQHMEQVARQHILPYLETGEEGVGYHIDLKHLQPTPIGASVRLCSTVTGLSANRVISRVEAWREPHDKQGKPGEKIVGEKIGEGFITQALVHVQALYAKAHRAASETETIENEPASSDVAALASGDEPPPATLQAQDETQHMALALLCWETGFFPCTRYDEWLICRVALVNGALQVFEEEGAFLLRHEIEECLEATQALLAGRITSFESDFLEPVLKLHLQRSEPSSVSSPLESALPGDAPYIATLCVTPMQAASPVLPEMITANAVKPDVTEALRRAEPVRMTFVFTAKQLQRFATELAVQLEGFPSRL